MQTYDALTKNGLLIHVSMSRKNTCYILIHDIYTHELNMKYFTDIETAIYFIRSI